MNILFTRVLFLYDDQYANLKTVSLINERVDSNCSGINTQENIGKRRHRYTSNPFPQTLETLSTRRKKSPTTFESELDSELVLTYSENNILGEMGKKFQNVSITNEDCQRFIKTRYRSYCSKISQSLK